MLNTLVRRENLKAFFKWAKFPYFFHTKCLAMVICNGGKKAINYGNKILLLFLVIGLENSEKK